MQSWSVGRGQNHPLGTSEQSALRCYLGTPVQGLLRFGILLICLALARSGFAAAPYRSQRAAQAAASRSRQKLDEYARRVGRTLAENNRLSDEYTQAFRELWQLEIDRQRTLQELREGRYCSKCQRSATEIERQLKIPFQKHLENVSGVGVAAPADLIARKNEEFARKIQSAREAMARIEDKHKRLEYEVSRCYHEEQQARAEYQEATLWATYLALVENDPPAGTQGHIYTPPAAGVIPDLAADTFGLSGNRQSSGYGQLRVYWKDGKVETATEGLSRDPDQMRILERRSVNYPSPGVRDHEGIDFTSRDATGRAKSQPFRAGFAGQVTRAGGGTENMISVLLDNGNSLEYLHAARILVDAGQRVSPNTVLGWTGDRGAKGSLHLHVQAKGANNKAIDPRVAVLKGHDIRAYIHQEAQRRANATREAVPMMRWPDISKLPTDEETDAKSHPMGGAGSSEDRPFVPIPKAE